MPCIARPCHIPCDASPDYTYTMLCPPGHTFSHAMPARPYHIHAMPIRPYHIPCHAHQAIPYTMACQPGHTIYHVMPRQAITYTMPCPLGHTIYLTMPARSYHIPCHATANDYVGKSCHERVRTVSLPDARLLVNSLVRWFRFIVCLCGLIKFMWKQAVSLKRWIFCWIQQRADQQNCPKTLNCWIADIFNLYRYIAHLYWLAVQAGSYSDVIVFASHAESRGFDPQPGQVRWYFSSPVTFGAQRK